MKNRVKWYSHWSTIDWISYAPGLEHRPIHVSNVALQWLVALRMNHTSTSPQISAKLHFHALQFHNQNRFHAHFNYNCLACIYFI